MNRYLPVGSGIGRGAFVVWTKETVVKVLEVVVGILLVLAGVVVRLLIFVVVLTVVLFAAGLRVTGLWVTETGFCVVFIEDILTGLLVGFLTGAEVVGF